MSASGATASSRVLRQKYKLERNARGPGSKLAENEIRITSTGSTNIYISYAAKLFQEKNYRAMKLIAAGNVLDVAVTVAEIMKRRFKGLHQITKIGATKVVDRYLPLEEGLDEVEQERNISHIEITLSLDTLDTHDSGYQPPLRDSLVKELPLDDLVGKRKKGKGKEHFGGGFGKGNYNPQGQKGHPQQHHPGADWAQQGKYGGKNAHQQQHPGQGKQHGSWGWAGQQGAYHPGAAAPAGGYASHPGAPGAGGEKGKYGKEHHGKQPGKGAYGKDKNAQAAAAAQQHHPQHQHAYYAQPPQQPAYYPPQQPAAPHDPAKGGWAAPPPPAPQQQQHAAAGPQQKGGKYGGYSKTPKGQTPAAGAPQKGQPKYADAAAMYGAPSPLEYHTDPVTGATVAHHPHHPHHPAPGPPHWDPAAVPPPGAEQQWALAHHAQQGAPPPPPGSVPLQHHHVPGAFPPPGAGWGAPPPQQYPPQQYVPGAPANPPGMGASAGMPYFFPPPGPQPGAPPQFLTTPPGYPFTTSAGVVGAPGTISRASHDFAALGSHPFPPPGGYSSVGAGAPGQPPLALGTPGFAPQPGMPPPQQAPVYAQQPGFGSTALPGAASGQFPPTAGAVGMQPPPQGGAK